MNVTNSEYCAAKDDNGDPLSTNAMLNYVICPTKRSRRGKSLSNRLELEPVRGAARLVVLEVDGAPEKEHHF